MRFLNGWRTRSQSTRSVEDRATGQPVSDSTFQWLYEPTAETSGDRYALVSRRSSVSQQARNAAVVHTSHPMDTPAGAADDSPAPPSQTVVPPILPTLATRQLVRNAYFQQESYLRNRLDIALGHWQTYGEWPSARLLLDGLAALDAGARFSSDQVSLLLTATLYYERGMLTALRHQDDPERTGLIVAEALTRPKHALSPETVSALLAEDPSADAWRRPLLTELQLIAAAGDNTVRRLAINALWHIENPPLAEDECETPRSVPNWIRASIAGIAVAIVGLASWFMFRPLTTASTVYLPAGAYFMLGDGGEQPLVSTDGFVIDKYEVTNRSYRFCVERNGCTEPRSVWAAGISNYYHDDAYDLHPVVNVNWEQAESYCRRRNMNLPTAEEWMLAAGAAPATGRPLAFPWGNTFDSHRTNTRDSRLLRPAETGSHSPAGDSPIGASDMAGNVAEWTATTNDGGTTYVVKGGSFLDGNDSAYLVAEREVRPDALAEWLGFRCVAR
jgi:formylglycine-generating enzyme required for sulfatase activity